MLTRHGNRVGALFYGDSVDTVIPARSGRRQVLHILHRMLTRPPSTAVGATEPGDLLDRRTDDPPRRSLVFVVSDFISTPGWAEPLAHLAQRHDVVAVRLYDPLEMDLPDLGLLVVQDAETGEQLFVDTHDKGFRKRFAERGRTARNRTALGVSHRRRRCAGARDERRSGRRDPALRRPAQAAQPTGDRRRPAAALRAAR